MPKTGFKRPRYTEEELCHIEDLLSEGVPYVKIGRKVGRSRSAIATLARRLAHGDRPVTVPETSRRSVPKPHVPRKVGGPLPRGHRTPDKEALVDLIIEGNFSTGDKKRLLSAYYSK